MNIVLFMISMLSEAEAGYALVGGDETLSLVERLVISFSVGAGLLSFYLFGLALFGVSFSMMNILLFFIPFVIIAAFRYKDVLKSFRFSPRIPLAGLSGGQRVVFSILAVFLIWKLLFIVFMICSG